MTDAFEVVEGQGVPCPGDVTGDGSVDVEDGLMVIAGYGTIYAVDDLLEVLAAFGSSC